MDDLLIGVQNGENLDAIIQEVDTGLKQANFVIKQWVKTGDTLQKQEKLCGLYSQSAGLSDTEQTTSRSLQKREKFEERETEVLKKSNKSNRLMVRLKTEASGQA